MELERNRKLFQQITRFVSNNQLLDRMEAKLNNFNPFKVLKVTQHEIRHSNMLAWLLNPKESHYFGDYFLKKVISEILCGDIVKINHSLQITDILVNDFSDAEIYREWRNIDLVVFSKKNDLVILIENKVNAGLSKNQLEKYLNIIKETYPLVKHIIPVFLTIEGEEAPNDEYYSLSHFQILDVLKLVLEIYKDRLSTKIFDFIYYYLQTLEELTMQDEKLISLCRDIYKQHKDAIDAIVKYGMLSNSKLHEVIDEMKNRRLKNIIDRSTEPKFFNNEKEIWFIPKSLSINLPTLIRKWKSPYPITYFFAKEEKKLRLILEIGPISDSNLRMELLDKLAGHESGLFSPSKSALTNINGSYTKVRTTSLNVTDWDNSDYLTERINHLLNEFKYDEVLQVLESLIQTFDGFQTMNEI